MEETDLITWPTNEGKAGSQGGIELFTWPSYLLLLTDSKIAEGGPNIWFCSHGDFWELTEFRPTPPMSFYIAWP